MMLIGQFNLKPLLNTNDESRNYITPLFSKLKHQTLGTTKTKSKRYPTVTTDVKV